MSFMPLESLPLDIYKMQLIYNKYLYLINMMPVSYFVLNEKGVIIEANDMAAKTLGLYNASLLNQLFSRYIAPEYQHIFSEQVKYTLDNIEVKPFDIKLLKRGCPSFQAKIFLKSVFIPEEKRVEILMMIINLNTPFFCIDVNHKFNKENSQMLTAITHSLNEPFSVIANYVYGSISRIQSATVEAHELLSIFKKISVQLERASKIILRIKHFQNKNVFEKKKYDIHQIIEETINLIKDETQALSINLIYRPLQQSVYVNIYKELIQQALLNLIRNSLEAIRDSRTFNPHIIIEVNQASPYLVEILIVDNGPGLSKEILHKIFDAHFTNKPYGTGLGLALSRNIIDDHGGSLTHEEYPVPGACFKLTLPIHKLND